MDTHVNYAHTTRKLRALKYDSLLRPPIILLINLLLLRSGAFWGSQLCYAKIGLSRSFYSLRAFEKKLTTLNISKIWLKLACQFRFTISLVWICISFWFISQALQIMSPKMSVMFPNHSLHCYPMCCTLRTSAWVLLLIVEWDSVLIIALGKG